VSAVTVGNRAEQERERHPRIDHIGAPGSARSHVARRGRRAVDTLITRLGRNEFRRRLWHFMPGCLAILATFIPHQEPVGVWVLVAAALFCALLAGLAWRYSSMFRRPEESNCLSLMSIFGYAAGIVPLFLLFPSQPELALTVTGVIAFGDGSATLFGLLFGKTKLPWNRKKTWVGLAAFVLVAAPMAMLIYWRGAIPPVDITAAVVCVVPTVLGSALVESLPYRLNDNVFVSCSAAAIVIAMHGLVVGWV